MNDSRQDRGSVVFPSGEDLGTWNAHVVSLRESESYLNTAISVNEVFVTIASPLNQILRIIGIPLRLLGIVTAGLVHFLFRLLLTPFFGMVLLTSAMWATSPRIRPALILMGPIFVMLSLWMLSLFPEEPEIRAAKTDLCRLWPLSRRRMEWIRTHRVH